MLLRFAKLAGGLRILVSQAAPIVATSVGLLSARTAAYLVGFGLGSIASIWRPIIAVLVSVTGFFGAGSSTAECEAYRAQMRAIDNANRVVMANYQRIYKSFLEEPYKSYLIQAQQLAIDAARSASTSCSGLPETGSQLSCDVYTHNNKESAYYTVYPSSKCESVAVKKITDYLQPPNFPLLPQLQIYPACYSPNFPPGKKVWVQVLWASPSGNFSDTKGCFIIAYSQEAPTVPPKIEYNPFLSEQFVRDRAISYYLVDGDRFRGLRDNDWKNLESVSGWDKGYWKSEQTDSECRGLRPGWSRKIK